MRRLVLLVACLLMAVGACAQEIVGQWVQEERQAENGMEIVITETFTVSKGGAFEQGVIMEMRMSDASGGRNEADKTTGKTTDKTDVKAGGKAGATTDQAAGKTVRLRISCRGNWTLTEEVLTQTFDVKSIRTEVLDQPEEFPKFFLNMLGKTVSSEFKKQSKKPYRSKIITMTSDKLVLRSLDEKDPETSTYTRKI